VTPIELAVRTAIRDLERVGIKISEFSVDIETSIRLENDAVVRATIVSAPGAIGNLSEHPRTLCGIPLKVTVK
jgi:hypothetical protein